MIDLCARAVAQLLNNSSCTIAQPVAILLKRQWVLVLLQFSYMGNSFSLAALQLYYHGFYHISQTIGIGIVQLRSYAFVCVCLLLQTGSTGFLYPNQQRSLPPEHLWVKASQPQVVCNGHLFLPLCGRQWSLESVKTQYTALFCTISSGSKPRGMPQNDRSNM